MTSIGKFCGLAAATIIGAAMIETPAVAQSRPVEARLSAADILKDDQSRRAFLESLPKVTFDGPLPRTYYLIEGDLLMDEEEVLGALRAYTDHASAPKFPGELKVMLKDNKPLIWQKTDRTLTYSVARSSFPSQASYEAVVKNMKAATDDWTSACPTCGVQFVHRAEQDSSPDVKQVTFVVAFKPNETNFIAAAFFPYAEQARRYLLIAPSYFESQFDGVGVLRHELGHVLGYRHEHIGGVPGCRVEDSNWKAVTAYDPKSAMHYYCGNGGTLKMQLTNNDKEGHSETYK